MTSAEARCNKSLRPRKPEGSLGRTAQDVHLDSHTAPELWRKKKKEKKMKNKDFCYKDKERRKDGVEEKEPKS